MSYAKDRRVIGKCVGSDNIIKWNVFRIAVRNKTHMHAYPCTYFINIFTIHLLTWLQTCYYTRNYVRSYVRAKSERLNNEWSHVDHGEPASTCRVILFCFYIYKGESHSESCHWQHSSTSVKSRDVILVNNCRVWTSIREFKIIESSELCRTHNTKRLAVSSCTCRMAFLATSD